MAQAGLDFIGRQLQLILTDLQQIKFAADVDRRNAASRYDNLVVAVGVKIGAFEATIGPRFAAPRDELNVLREGLNVVHDGLKVVREELLGRFDRIEQLLNKA